MISLSRRATAISDLPLLHFWTAFSNVAAVVCFAMNDNNRTTCKRLNRKSNNNNRCFRRIYIDVSGYAEKKVSLVCILNLIYILNKLTSQSVSMQIIDSKSEFFEFRPKIMACLILFWYSLTLLDWHESLFYFD